MCNHGGVNFSRSRASWTACCRGGDGKCRQWGRTGQRGSCAPRRAAQRSPDVQRKVQGTESSQITPVSPHTSLLLRRGSARRWAGGLSASSNSDGGSMGLCAVCRALLPAVAGPLPVSAPLITAQRRPRQAGPIGSSCLPRTARQRRVSPAPLRQAKYSVLPWPSAGQESGGELPPRRSPSPAQSGRWAPVGWGSPWG